MFWSNLFLEEIGYKKINNLQQISSVVQATMLVQFFLWIVSMILNIILEQTLLILAVVYGQLLYSLCICASLKYVIHTMCVGGIVYL